VAVDDINQATASPSSMGSKDSMENDKTEDAPERKALVVSHILRGLENDTKFLQDGLSQVRALKAKAGRHDMHRAWAQEWLDDNTVCFSPSTKAAYPLTTWQPAITESQKQKAAKMATRCLREAKACEKAAERAQAKAKEYRRKATELLYNTIAEIEILDEDEDDVE
jgi:hypothetical protein